MSMSIYNKLVRNNIPQIIIDQGHTPNIEMLTDNEYRKQLDIKLLEEIEEYTLEQSVEELADIVEVVYAILDCMNISTDEFERIRLQKVEDRGSFSKKIFLLSVN